jgi:hypothetical protein
MVPFTRILVGSLALLLPVAASAEDAPALPQRDAAPSETAAQTVTATTAAAKPTAPGRTAAEDASRTPSPPRRAGRVSSCRCGAGAAAPPEPSGGS